MPLFKQTNTTNIKINKKKLTTLDGKHKELIQEYTKAEKEQLPKLRNEKKILQEQLSIAEDIKEKLDIKDQIKTINREISEIKQNKKNYLLNNSKYIFEYFEQKRIYLKIFNLLNLTNILL